jgi:hypothetical protein
MDSSGVLLFRVAVMLCCLILVPAAAVFGSQFPQVVRQYIEVPLRKLMGWEASTATANHPWKSTADSIREAAPPYSPVQGNALENPNLSAASAPQWQAPPAAQQPVPHEADYIHGQQGALPTKLVNHQAGAPTQGDRFSYIQHLLRLYGALNYRLESTGPHGELYQFSCQMPKLDGQPADFTATHADPLQAMDQVLRRVEAWRDRVLHTATQRQ